MPDQKLVPALACEIRLGPLMIKTEASVEQVAELILRLVREYRDLPIVTTPIV